LTHFGSVEKVKTALYSELQEVVGKSSATKVLNYYKID
jgi:excinuclease UvrABC nuclease subunit